MSDNKYIKRFEEIDDDIIVYCGDINRDGYEKLTDICINEKISDSAYLVLNTCGGDPHAGFRMARCFRHYYGNFKVVIPYICKSAGTLVVMGGSELIIADKGELGPLDVQMMKPDELIERSSGMVIPQALSMLRNQAKAIIADSILEIKLRSRLSTKLVAEIATKLATDLLTPIYAQIDPYRLGEMNRANAIGYEYGERLNKDAKNLKSNALPKIVAQYPDHGFVIDRKEAATLFKKVRAPTDIETKLILKLLDDLSLAIDNPDPICFNLNRIKVEENKDVSKEGENDGVSTSEGSIADKRKSPRKVDKTDSTKNKS
ncbi:S49 family peptidase domain-containing protein [Entomomonas asaccharolytica]|uniref:Serine dehydrogenase proteinase n=1 Tax=Entomomonas asaccharolytica TaxID=2785331 RepID=A0A974RY46_9GAMM|nr:hypothetical protein [Entomomonas asaccharolytica]QQP86913.1 hypothetical protein JHT90_06625 [Entomomonas asaccharolytica]